MAGKVIRISYYMIAMLLLCTTAEAGQLERIEHDGQSVIINYDGAFTRDEHELTYRWLNKVASALLTVYGQFPKDQFMVIARRAHHPDSPVPWGQVERSEPTRVLLVINPALGYQALVGDWTAYHEFSHLLIPYEGFGDVWLSEGLATYYQNIIQTRAGLLDEQQMWQRVVAGLERGRNEHEWDHMNLTEVSNNLGETRQFMRVHWSGVLFWLNVDVQLRQQGSGTQDELLKKLKRCCQNRSMSANDIVRKLDELAATDYIAEMFEIYCNSHAVPDYDNLLEELGVDINSHASTIKFSEHTTLAQIRRQLTAGQGNR